MKSINLFLATGLFVSIATCAPAVAQKGGHDEKRPHDSSNLNAAANDPLLVSTLYAVPKRLVSQVADSGAVSVNNAFERGEGTKWYIEQQRYGADLVQAGVARHDDGLIKQGLKILDWGFARQGADGSFPGTGDPFHSTTFFVEAAARALLLLKNYGSGAYAETIRIDTPKLLSAALWLTKADVAERGKKNNSPYTHRRWILAAALGQAGAVTGNETLKAEAAEYAREGLSLQQEDGVDPEKGGADVSYQAVGLLFAARYYMVCTDPDLRTKIREAIRRGLQWESGKVAADGKVDAEGSTRTGVEESRGGQTKHVDYKNLVQAFVLGGEVTGDPAFHEMARRVAEGRGWMEHAKRPHQTNP